MKKMAVIFWLFILPLTAFSQNILPVYGLSPMSYGKAIKSCYRWIAKHELKKWSKGKVYLGKLFRDQLGRASDADITYCWTNPVTAAVGGRLETYGSYLMRIDLIDDAVIFNRNTNTYSSSKEKLVTPVPMQLGVDTEVVYANYSFNGGSWFQEYLIRSSKVIKGWSLNDQSLKDDYRREVAKLYSHQIPVTQYHFFRNFYTYETSKGFFSDSGHPYYIKHMGEIEKNLEEFWAKNPGDLTFKNKDVRPAIQGTK